MSREGTGDGPRLRLARLARGMSQSDLADAAGVTRQAVAGIEAGAHHPSLRVALALAGALSVQVEDLFGPPPRRRPLPATPLAAPSPTGPAPRVELARVGPRLVAVPLIGSVAARAGFSPAGAVTEDSSTSPWRVRPLGPSRPTLVVAGCDPALPLLSGPLAMLDPPVGLSWWPCSTSDALALASAGLVHAAGVHRADGGPLSGFAEGARASDGDEVLAFSEWREGLAYRPGLAPVAGVEDVAERGWRLVNREPGSEARELLDRQLAAAGLEGAEIVGYESAATGHLLVASALFSGLGDVGVTTEPAALSMGLRFTPLAEERSALVVPHALIDTEEVAGLLRVLSSPALREQLGAIPGYGGVDRCGSPLA